MERAAKHFRNSSPLFIPDETTANGISDDCDWPAANPGFRRRLVACRRPRLLLRQSTITRSRKQRRHAVAREGLCWVEEHTVEEARARGERRKKRKGRKRNARERRTTTTTTDEIRRATLVGARVCPCIHPCTPGGGDRRVLISPSSPSLPRRSHPPLLSLPLCPGRLCPRCRSCNISPPAHSRQPSPCLFLALSRLSLSLSSPVPLSHSNTPISLEPPVVVGGATDQDRV